MYRKSDKLEDLYKKLQRNMEKESLKKLLDPNFVVKINYSPDYQRNYVWGTNKAIKLIETILINGEVPPITVIVTDGVYEIMDGRQRYESLLRYFNDEFPLRAFGLSLLKDLDGLTYSQLPKNVKTRFNDYKLKMITYTLENGVYFTGEDLDKVKRDLFRRYNYGMTALSPSEVARAKYLYDPLTIEMSKYFKDNRQFYDNCISMFIHPSKRDYNDREKMNLLLINFRELLSFGYIPVIGVYNVKCSISVIEKYYESFVKKQDLVSNKEEFIKICNKVFLVKTCLDQRHHLMRGNVLFFKCVYWMLTILYKTKSQSFYEFDPLAFCHYVENSKQVIEYFDNYVDLSSEHIINRYKYMKEYVSNNLKLDVDEYLESIVDNRKHVVYKRPVKLCSDEDWLGIKKCNQLITQDEKFTVSEIIELIKDGRFVVRPVYQRTEVKSKEKASKVIESLLLGVKLPPLYVTVKQNASGLPEYTVIDGQQRVTNILRFMGEEITDEKFDYIKTFKNNYALTGLKDSSDLVGKTFEGTNSIGESNRNLIREYQIDVIKIEKQANPDFDAVDMFLRLNENPCTIRKNTFEMWNSYDVVETLNKIKKIAKYDLFKQDGNAMKEEELVTILAYMDYKKVNLYNFKDFFKIHIDARNKGKRSQRSEIKIAITYKGAITNFLESLIPGSETEKKFLTSLDKVQQFVNKLELLRVDNRNCLIEIFNPYLIKARKVNMKDFYIMWLILADLDTHIIKTYRDDILNEIKNIFNLMKNVPENINVEFFIDNIRLFVDKYISYVVK